MITKAPKRKEVELGFVHIPVKNRAELIGDAITPFETKVNNFPAKVDKHGRLWCSELRNKYTVNSEIELSRDESGFVVNLNGKHAEESPTEINLIDEDAPFKSADYSSGKEPRIKIIEGDCVKLLEEKSIGNIDLTFFDLRLLKSMAINLMDALKSLELMRFFEKRK